MSDTDIVLSGDSQQQQQRNEKQITFSQADFEELAAAQLFDEQECMFIENLNVDAEEKASKITKITTEPIIEQTEKEAEEDLDDLKKYILKCVSRQDISPNFAAMESDFYDKVEMCVDEMTENSFFRMETFVNTRLERIIMYSKSFSHNIWSMLTAEERQLYTDLCESVRRYREKIDERLKLNK